MSELESICKKDCKGCPDKVSDVFIISIPDIVKPQVYAVCSQCNSTYNVLSEVIANKHGQQYVRALQDFKYKRLL